MADAGLQATKQSILSLRGEMDCFAEPVIGRAFARSVGSSGYACFTPSAFIAWKSPLTVPGYCIQVQAAGNKAFARLH